MQKTDNVIVVLDILKNELTNCFKRGVDKMPLALGIHKQVLKHFENDPRFDSMSLQKAIGLYCNGSKYLGTIIEGAPRIDINGTTVCTVKSTEALYARRILAERKGKKNKKKLKTPAQ